VATLVTIDLHKRTLDTNIETFHQTYYGVLYYPIALNETLLRSIDNHIILSSDDVTGVFVLHACAAIC